jgi:phosphonate transport system substrate-binding protein
VPAPLPKPDEEPPEKRLGTDDPIRMSGIPDADKEKLAKQYEIVTTWLSKELGRKVVFVPVNDYAAAVTAMASRKVDLAWFGGVTAVQAIELTKNRCQPIIAREEDLKFKSYFIANKKLVDAGTFTSVKERVPMPLEALAAMKPAFAGLSFTFGALTSTSGHIMPRYFLELPAVGLDPEKDFKSKPGFALQGGHSAVLANVASGAFDLGVLNYLSWEQATDELKAQAPVIYVTPEYADSCMVSHGRMGPVLPLRVMSAFLELDPSNPEDKAVLDVFGSKKFVRAPGDHLERIGAIVKSAQERGILE